MPLIKICGVKDPAIAQFAASCGAHYIGIVFHPVSKRYVPPNVAKQIAAAAQEAGAQPVGVFVGVGAEEIIAMAQYTRITHIQAYGLKETLPSNFYRFYPDGNIDQLRPEHDFVLIDGPIPGSGQSLNWDELAPPSSPWFLAGGLDCNNIDTAILHLKPHGVDVSSGVETDRKKDPKKIRELIEKVKAYD